MELCDRCVEQFRNSAYGTSQYAVWICECGRAICEDHRLSGPDWLPFCDLCWPRIVGEREANPYGLPARDADDDAFDDLEDELLD